MTGRNLEIARLGQIVDRACPNIRVVEISGNPWMGKTRLMAEFSDAARRHGWKVAAGVPGPLLGGLPFGAFSDAIHDALAEDAPAWFADLGRVDAGPVGGIFPALSTTAATDAIAVHRTLHAVRALLESLSSPAGLLLTFDDVHQADEASVELLSHLVCHAPVSNFVVALAYRPLQAGPKLLSLLTEVRGIGRSCQIDLTPLADEDAVALLPAGLSRSRRRTMLGEAGGNPGLLRALASVGAYSAEPGSAAGLLPRDVSATCLRDFRALSRNAWLVARAAALVAEPFETDLLMGVAQLGEAEIWPALDELTGQDVLRPAGSLRKFRFRNSLLRTAAYHSAGIGWRLGAHSRAAAKLAARGAPATLLARHLEHSVRFDEATTVQTLLAAAQSSLWDGPARAVTWVRAANDLKVVAPAGALLLLGQALTLAGPIGEGIETLSAIGPAAQVWAETVLWRAWGMRLLGRPADAAAEVRSLSAADGGAAQGVRAQLDLALLACDIAESTAPAETVRDRASGCADPALRAHGLALLGVADLKLGFREQAVPPLREAGRLLDALPDAEVVLHLEALRWLGQAESMLGWYPEARIHLERGVSVADQRSLHSLLPGMAIALAALLVRLGDRGQADRHADRAQEAAELAGSAFLLGAALDLKRRLVSTDLRQGADGGPLAGPGDAPGDSRESLERQHGDLGADLSLLSERELEIAGLVSDGRTNQQIARVLGLSHKTVETYLGRIFKKFDFCSRAQVAATIGKSLGAGNGVARLCHTGSAGLASQGRPGALIVSAPDASTLAAVSKRS